MRLKHSKIFTFILIFTLVLSFIPNTTNATNLFADIEKSYAKANIEALAEAGIIGGIGNNKFGPTEPMTRAQLAKVLVYSLGLEENSSVELPFTDVPKDAWYKGVVGALVNSGLTSGTSKTTFSPNANVTREELAVFFVRTMGLEDEVVDGDYSAVALTDLEKVSPWARGSVALSNKIGFIGGIKNNDGTYYFNPKGKADRQALAALTYRFYFHKDDYTKAIKQPVNEPVAVEEPEQTEEVVENELEASNTTEQATPSGGGGSGGIAPSVSNTPQITINVAGQAKKSINGEVDLSNMSDDSRITNGTILSTKDGQLTINSVSGIPLPSSASSQQLKANNSSSINILDFSEYDKEGDGVRIETLRDILGKDTITVEGTLTDNSNNVSNVSFTIILPSVSKNKITTP